MTSPQKHEQFDTPPPPKGWLERWTAFGFWVGGLKAWLIVLFLNGFGLYELAKQELSIRQWKQAQGTVLESETVWLEQKKGSFGPPMTVRIRYRYAVGDYQYESTRLTTGDPVLFYDVQQAAKFRKQHPPGAKVTVLYAPYAPSKATLLAERGAKPWILLGFGVPWLLLVIYRNWRRRTGVVAGRENRIFRISRFRYPTYDCAVVRRSPDWYPLQRRFPIELLMGPTMKDLGIDQLSLEQRIALALEIWESLGDIRLRGQLTAEQRAELARRNAELARIMHSRGRGRCWQECKGLNQQGLRAHLLSKR